MIGLRRHHVRVVPHQEEWAARFAAEREDLLATLGGHAVDIQHIGSTAVPGLAAKPVIDIAAAVRSLAALPEIIEALARTGYIYRRDSGQEGGHLFVRESAPEIRCVHLHVVQQGDPQWQHYLEFRDLLRADGELRHEYAELKLALARRYANDRKSYTGAKQEFIQSILRQKTGSGQTNEDSPPTHI